ncbi:hypothetical protein [Micromonospora sp. NPDC092111]|uniref:hypothetical protein n=1 Tax=Micromonospora sp. NPDC092111 TaxID=3364289 RepID=UPI00382E390B
MIPAASTRPVWVSRLRDLTRLAVTALVLAVGIGGLFAASGGPAAAASAGRPNVVASRVAELPAGTRPEAEQAVEAPARPVPARRAAVPAARPATPAGPATTDPARDGTGRRGPPRS